MPIEADIPADSPLRIYHKRGLPTSIASTQPHGHISGHPRSPAAQRAFDARKATILRTMDAEKIETAYQENLRKILTILEEDRKKNEEIDRESEKLEAQRQLERKIFWKQKEERAARDGKATTAEVKEEADP